MQQRQVAPQRGHHPDARVRVAEPGMNVHAADDEAPHAFLERRREARVALAPRDLLFPPPREGMGGGGHRRRPVPFRGFDDDPPRLAQRRAQLGHRAAHLRIGLDLGAQQLPHHLVRSAGPLAHLEDSLIGIDEQIARVGIDQKQLLLHPESDGEFVLPDAPGHRPLHWQ